MEQEPSIYKIKVAVVGAGITGLSAAYSLQEAFKKEQQSAEITLIEASTHLGGKIITEQSDGFTIEGGPDCYMSQKPWATQLALQIGLQNEIIGTNDARRKTYVINHGKPVPLPDGVMLIVPTRIMPFALSRLISIPGKLRMGMDLFIPPFKGDGDETVAGFVRRRLGNEALDKIAEPLLSGIHVSDPEQQSLLASFPRFRALEKNHGSMIAGMVKQRRAPKKKVENPSTPQSMFLSMREGLGQMTRKLSECLIDVDILSGQRVTHIEHQAQGSFRLSLSQHPPLEVDAVILATPARDSAEIMPEQAAALADELRKIRFVSTATVSMGFRKSDIQQPINGFGFIIPGKEKRDISACTWTSIKFDERADESHFLLRCFVGGPNKEEMVTLSDDDIIATVRRELKSLMGLDAEPVLTRIYRWEKSHPQYDLNHLDLIRRIHALCDEIPGLYLAGSSFEGVGIPDCIRQGQEAAAKAVDHIHKQTTLDLV